jgi:hypothetical protein
MQSLADQWYDEDRGIHFVSKAPASHMVVDSKGLTKHSGNHGECKAWIRKYNAEFFCRVEEVPCASPSSATSPAMPSKPSTQWTVTLMS